MKEISFTFTDSRTKNADVLVLPVLDDGSLTVNSSQLKQELEATVKHNIDSDANFKGKNGQSFFLPLTLNISKP